MSSLEFAGEPDPRGARDAKITQRETLDDIEEEIGADMYHSIINDLSRGIETKDLSPEKQEIIARIKSKMTH